MVEKVKRITTTCPIQNSYEESYRQKSHERKENMYFQMDIFTMRKAKSSSNITVSVKPFCKRFLHYYSFRIPSYFHTPYLVREKVIEYNIQCYINQLLKITLKIICKNLVFSSFKIAISILL